MIGIDVPLKRLAEEAGGAIMRNVVALGAACEVAEFPIENLDSALGASSRIRGRSSSTTTRRPPALDSRTSTRSTTTSSTTT